MSQHNPLHLGTGKHDNKNTEKQAKYEKKWKEMNGAKIYYEKLMFSIKATRKRPEKTNHVVGDKDDYMDEDVDGFWADVEEYLKSNFKSLKAKDEVREMDNLDAYYEIQHAPYITDASFNEVNIILVSHETMFDMYTTEMVRAHIIKFADKHFGKRDLDVPGCSRIEIVTPSPGTDYVLCYNFGPGNNITSNVIICGANCMNGGKCFGKLEDFNETLGPHLKKMVVENGEDIYKTKKLVYPKGVIIDYHLLPQMQGKERIKQKNLPTEWDYSGISVPFEDLNVEEKYNIYKINKSESCGKAKDIIMHVGADKEGNHRKENIAIPSFWVREAINSMDIGERAVIRYTGSIPGAKTGNAKDDSGISPKYIYTRYVGYIDTEVSCCDGAFRVKLGKKLVPIRDQERLKGFEEIVCCNQSCHCVGCRSLCQCVLCLQGLVFVACFSD